MPFNIPKFCFFFVIFAENFHHSENRNGKFGCSSFWQEMAEHPKPAKTKPE